MKRIKGRVFMYPGKSGLWFLIVSIATIVVDYFSKCWILANIKPYNIEDMINVIPGCFRIVHVHNTGAAFSFLAQYPGWQQWIFGALAVIISGYLVYLLSKSPSNRVVFNLAGSLIIGGALGNFVDRVTYGHVVDFLDFYLSFDSGEKHYPAFNVADIAICLGVFLFICAEVWGCKKSVHIKE